MRYIGTDPNASTGGASIEGAVYENETVISGTHTITADKNGFSVGPITLEAGASVTVPSGQRWVVL
jgi:hypothetical protein